MKRIKDEIRLSEVKRNNKFQMNQINSIIMLANELNDLKINHQHKNLSQNLDLLNKNSYVLKNYQ